MSTHISVPPQLLLERILTLEIVRVTERAAVSAALGHLSEREQQTLLAHEVSGQDMRSLATELNTTAGAVAAQALRRIGARPAPEATALGTVTVILSGRQGGLPAPALAYAEGRLLQAVSPAQ